MPLIKREILISCEFLSMKSCMRNQFLFCKKEACHLLIFLASNVSIAKKIDTACFVKIYKVSADKGIGKSICRVFNSNFF